MSLMIHVKRIWQALPLSDHARWLITRIILEPILPLIKGSVIHSAYLKEKAWQSQKIRPFHGDLPPTLPPQEKQDIFLWGVIDWRFRIQRPQHLAMELASRGYRVFYISTAFVNSGRPGFELEPMDKTGRLFNVRLHMKGRPLIYEKPPNNKDTDRLKSSVASLLMWTRSRAIISIVQHPYWYGVAATLPNSHLVYDCLDLHEGFSNTGTPIASLEKAIITNADSVVVSSQRLRDIARKYRSQVSVVRNATEYSFFSTPPSTTFKDARGRSVIGYYGAIAEWMDIDLLARIATAFPKHVLLLVGADECGARLQLAKFDNVVLTGEVPYSDLPHYLYGMHVCILPFKIIPLTLATNPVKIYEYLAAGKPVVAVDLPEMEHFGDHVFVAANHEEFISKTSEALASSNDVTPAKSRQHFASMNTWSHRTDSIIAALDSIYRPTASVIVVTYNNLELTKACLKSLDEYTDYDAFEVIVIDNASTDGTREFLQCWAAGRHDRQFVLNVENRGFAAANNQGLAMARGEYLVLLNNDTEVTSGWLPTLMKYLMQDDSIGMIGPVTNNIGNEAKIGIRYRESIEMHEKARKATINRMGKSFNISTLAFFCVMMPRWVYEKTGPLDEAYGLGFFEDDDYCRRVEQEGLRLVCAEDVFIHHHLSASFNKLGKGRQELLDKNRKIYESKWGPWTPHQHRKKHE